MEDPKAQTVKLDDERTSALFTEDGRVFYDLNHLLIQYSQITMARAMAARLSDDDCAKAMVLGEIELLDKITDSLEVLRAGYEIENMTSPADFL